MRVRASVASTVGCALAWIASAQHARAEALPGELDLFGGAHAMVLAAERCEQDGDQVSCGGGAAFAGFQLGGHAQLGPRWFALGVRLSGSSELDGTARVGSDGFFEVRDVWLWRAAARARFDPPLWPRALWFAAELGAAFAVETIRQQTFGVVRETSSDTAGLLAGLSVGWDFDVYEGLVFGLELQGQLIALSERTLPDRPGFVREDPVFPYISLGAHAGYRF